MENNNEDIRTLLMSYTAEIAAQAGEESCRYNAHLNTIFKKDIGNLSIFDYYCHKNGVDFKTAFRTLANEFAPDHDCTDEEIKSAYISNAQSHLRNNQYHLQNLGLSWFFDRAHERKSQYYNLGFDTSFINPQTGNNQPVFILPDEHGEVTIFDHISTLYLPETFRDNLVPVYQNGAPDYEAVFITANDFDAMTLTACGADAIPFRSYSALIKTHKSQQSHRPIVLAITNREQLEQAYRTLTANNTPDLFVMNDTIGDTSIYTSYIKYGADFKSLIDKWRDPVKIQFKKKYSMKDYFPRFKASVKQSEKLEPISTGWKEVDEMIGGGLFPYLYILGGRTGSGKTAVALNIADSVAKQRVPVLYISLEVSKNEFIARSLSRIVYEQAGRHWMREIVHLDESGISFGVNTKKLLPEEIDRLNLAEKEYLTYAGNLYIHESVVDCTVNNIEDLLRQTVHSLHKTPVLIVDYLQGLKKTDVHMSDKENIDRAVHALKTISRDYNTPVICLTSNNREATKAGKTTETSSSGSGQIEYTADFLFSWQPEPTDMSYEEWRKAHIGMNRPMDLFLIKNRHGEAFKAVRMQYTSKYCYISVDQTQEEE